MVERLTVDQKVVGSTPISLPKQVEIRTGLRFGFSFIGSVVAPSILMNGRWQRE